VGHAGDVAFLVMELLAASDEDIVRGVIRFADLRGYGTAQRIALGIDVLGRIKNARSEGRNTDDGS